MILGHGNAVLISARYFLRIVYHYRLVEVVDDHEPWKVATAGYSYALDGRDNRAGFAYHWHPAGASPVRTLHLHVGEASQGTPAAVDVHFPTGFIAIHDVVRLLIRDFKITARRADWDNLLESAEATAQTSPTF